MLHSSNITGLLPVLECVIKPIPDRKSIFEQSSVSDYVILGFYLLPHRRSDPETTILLCLCVPQALSSAVSSESINFMSISVLAVGRSLAPSCSYPSFPSQLMPLSTPRRSHLPKIASKSPHLRCHPSNIQLLLSVVQFPLVFRISYGSVPAQ